MGVQNHHIINEALFGVVLQQTGLNLDTSALNRINLPNTRAAGQRLGLPFHRGPHTGTGYSDYVTREVRAILGLPLDRAGKAAAIERLIGGIRIGIESNLVEVSGSDSASSGLNHDFFEGPVDDPPDGDSRKPSASRVRQVSVGRR